MGKNKLLIPRIALFTVFFILKTGNAFAQVPNLALYTNDVRLESYYQNNDLIGYILVVRKKTGMESVMLTESSGNYALRAREWNVVNGNERRELSNRPIGDVHSRYSILSSTPVNDLQFGSAYRLFLPFTVVYGNPSSPCGIVTLDMRRDIQFNIRTFDCKYADPNIGRHQNNTVWLNY